jgi:hypothetical protein
VSFGTASYPAPLAQSPHQRGLGTAHGQIDRFYDWIYQRGVERLAARGTTTAMLYQSLQQRKEQR